MYNIVENYILIIYIVLPFTLHIHDILLFLQSPYFSCMFNGSWSESSSKNVVIDVADPNIDETGE